MFEYSHIHIVIFIQPKPSKLAGEMQNLFRAYIKVYGVYIPLRVCVCVCVQIVMRYTANATHQ